MGSLLFILYKSDLPSVVSSCQVGLYADDICLYTSGNSFQNVIATLQLDLNRLSNWFTNNLMSLNCKKTELVLFSKFRNKQQSMPSKLSIGGHTIQPVEQAKYLGVIFDCNLTWRPQLDAVVKKVSRKIGILRRIGRNLNTAARSAFARSVMFPDLDF